MTSYWQPNGWEQLNCAQLDFYPFHSFETKSVISALQILPHIVASKEVDDLKCKISKIQAENGFILHGGYCAESFSEANVEYVKRQTQLFEELTHLIQKNLNQPIIRIARIAGQYGKPRTQKMMQSIDELFPNYHGDIINGIDSHPWERLADPLNMLIAYANANKIYRFIKKLKKSEEDHQIYTSHEAFLLPYESALTKKIDGQWYNLSAHFLWLGYRSIYKNSPHIEYIRGIANPIGIKLGPQISLNFLIETIKKINPENEAGKVAIIYRFGVRDIQDLLPRYVEAIQKNNLYVTWMCDPMHGNTHTYFDRKVRFIKHMLSEINQAVSIHHHTSTQFSGLHLEFTGEQVDECVYDENELVVAQKIVYTSLMDPRLNPSQVKELIKNSLAFQFEMEK